MHADDRVKRIKQNYSLNLENKTRKIDVLTIYVSLYQLSLTLPSYKHFPLAHNQWKTLFIVSTT